MLQGYVGVPLESKNFQIKFGNDLKKKNLAYQPCDIGASGRRVARDDVFSVPK